MTDDSKQTSSKTVEAGYWRSNYHKTYAQQSVKLADKKAIVLHVYPFMTTAQRPRSHGLINFLCFLSVFALPRELSEFDYEILIRSK